MAVAAAGGFIFARGSGLRLGHNQHKNRMWKEAKRLRNIKSKDLAERIHNHLKNISIPKPQTSCWMLLTTYQVGLENYECFSIVWSSMKHLIIGIFCFNQEIRPYVKRIETLFEAV